jgi:hypothetical protein
MGRIMHWGVAALGLVAVLVSAGASAKDPIGKAALSAIAPLGGTIEQARRGLSGAKVDEIGTPSDQLVLWTPEVNIGMCQGRVFAVTRLLGDSPDEGMRAIMSIAAVAGAPQTRAVQVTGPDGGQGLAFFWPSISDYEIQVSRGSGTWASTEGTFRRGLCR